MKRAKKSRKSLSQEPEQPTGFPVQGKPAKLGPVPGDFATHKIFLEISWSCEQINKFVHKECHCFTLKKNFISFKNKIKHFLEGH